MEQPVFDQITDPNRQGISNAICRKEKQKELRRRGAGIRAVLCIGYTNPIIAALLSTTVSNHLVLQDVHSTLHLHSNLPPFPKNTLMVRQSYTLPHTD